MIWSRRGAPQVGHALRHPAHLRQGQQIDVNSE
jgi:hypothetical protein